MRGFDANAFRSVNRMLSSAATVTESAGNAAALIIDKSSALAEGTSNAMEASMSVVKAAWNGVDLAGLVANKSRIHIEAVHIAGLEDWLASDDRLTALPGAPSEAVEIWMAAIHIFSWWRPQVFISKDALNLTGTFWATWVRCSISDRGRIALDITLVQMSFEPRWANPTWELLQWDLACGGGFACRTDAGRRTSIRDGLH